MKFSTRSWNRNNGIHIYSDFEISIRLLGMKFSWLIRSIWLFNASSNEISWTKLNQFRCRTKITMVRGGINLIDTYLHMEIQLKIISERDIVNTLHQSHLTLFSEIIIWKMYALLSLVFHRQYENKMLI